MSSLGPYLRELREQRGYSLEEVSRATRIARPALEALERSDFQRLPAPVFIRGFIRAYCQALEVPVTEALARYANPHHESAAEPREAPPPSREEPTTAATRGRGPLLISFVLLVALGAALFAVTLALQSGRDAPERRSEAPETRRDARPAEPDAASSQRNVEPVVTPPASVASTAKPAEPISTANAPEKGAPPGAATPGAAVNPRPASAAPPAVQAPAPQAPPAAAVVGGPVAPPYRLIARTTEPTWIRVRTDDGHVTEETLPPGQQREWVSNGRFTITVGNAGGVAFELNGRPVAPLGTSGQVVRGVVLPGEAP